MDIIVLFFVRILRTYRDLSIVISFIIVDSDDELLGRRFFVILGAHVRSTFFPLLCRTIQFVQGGGRMTSILRGTAVKLEHFLPLM
jgi:hypothetical protein